MNKGGNKVGAFPRDLIKHSRLITKLVDEFNSDKVDMQPAPGKDFGNDTVNKVVEFLQKFPTDKKSPKKPLLIFVTFNDWLDHNFDENTRVWLEDFLKPKNFYELVELFNCAFYLQVDLLKEIVAARIAHSIILERKAPEDFLRDFGIVNKYQEYFTPEEEKQFIDKEFINKHDFEDVAADDDEELLKEETK